jgi:molybdopterin molybdotransferase
MINKQPSCQDIFESGLMAVDAAKTYIASQIEPLALTETVLLNQAVKRILAENIIAPFNVPPHDNSAVDGFALSSGDIPTHGTRQLLIDLAIHAGDNTDYSLKPGHCCRIMTGARIPAGADTVLMQEHVESKDGFITLDSQAKAGDNIRLAGEDLAQGETILPAGQFLTAADIGLLASLGIGEIKVKRKLRIAIASTGNEVFDIGEKPADSGIYDSNRYSLQAALQSPAIEIINLGIIKDDPEQLQTCFQQASQFADVIIASGGVSVGDADHTKTALQSNGQIKFWKLAIKPGRPMAFGHLGDCLFFGLPGNPVAVMVTYYLFVKPALERKMGIRAPLTRPTIQAITQENIRKKPGRTEIVRGILTQQENGVWQVKTTGKQGSGILRSMSLANCFIILEHERTSVKAGETVTVQPFHGLFD